MLAVSVERHDMTGTHVQREANASLDCSPLAEINWMPHHDRAGSLGNVSGCIC